MLKNNCLYCGHDSGVYLFICLFVIYFIKFVNFWITSERRKSVKTKDLKLSSADLSFIPPELYLKLEMVSEVFLTIHFISSSNAFSVAFCFTFCFTFT